MAIGHFYEKIVKNAPILKNQFYVSMTGVLPNLDAAWMEQELHYYARGATLPKFTVKSADLSFHGQTFAIPTICAFEHELQLTVYCDKELRIWKFWKNWLDELSQFNHSGGVGRDGILRGIRGVTDTQIKLDLLKDVMFSTPAQNPPEETDIIAKYTLEGAFPVSIGAIEFGHEDATVVTFPIDLKYQYFYESDKNPLS